MNPTVELLKIKSGLALKNVLVLTEQDVKDVLGKEIPGINASLEKSVDLS